MSKHTPGPWSVDPSCWGDIQAAGSEIATAFFSGNVGSSYCITGQITAALDEARANARLIAAAPDLLDVLQACSDYLDCIPEAAVGGDDDAVRIAKAARAAISKATGEA